MVSSLGHYWTSQVPEKTILCFCPALRSRLDRTHLAIIGAYDTDPIPNKMKSLAKHDFETESRGFNICCLRFTHSVTTINARLASGWQLTFAGRELNPLVFNE